MTDHIKLPAERVEQLRRLAKNLDMTIADCIAMFVREQIEKGNLQDEVPGITITRQGKQITLDTGSFRSVLPKDLAKSYAEQVRRMVEPIITPSKSNPFLPEVKLNVTRRGTSIKLVDKDSGAEKTLAPSVAKDFARVLFKAAS